MPNRVLLIYLHSINYNSNSVMAQSAAAVEYTDWFSAEG